MKFRSALRVALPLLAALALMGCTTLFQSRPADAANGAGMRYWLPRPHILMSPQADGSVQVQVVYLPDESREYTIEASALASRLDLNVVYDKEAPWLLSEVSLDAGNASVADSLIDNAAAVREAEINARQTAEQAAATQRQGVLTQIQTLEMEIVTRQAEYDVLATRTPVTDAITTRRNDLQLEIAQREAQIAALRERMGLSADSAARGNRDQGEGANQGARFPMAYGPVLFRVESTRPTAGVTTARPTDGVRLVAVDQITAAVIPPLPVRISLSPRGTVYAKREGGRVSFEVTASVDIELPAADYITVTTARGVAVNIDAEVSLVDKKVTVTLPGATAAGEYIVSVPFRVKDGTSDQPISIRVLVPPVG